MAKQDINYGTTAGDGTGESLFAAFKKAKENFDELYGAKTEFVANYAALPATGEALKIYVALDTGVMYRWSGSAYVQMTLGFTTTSSGNTVLVGADGVSIPTMLKNKTVWYRLRHKSGTTLVDAMGNGPDIPVVADAGTPNLWTTAKMATPPDDGTGLSSTYARVIGNAYLEALFEMASLQASQGLLFFAADIYPQTSAPDKTQNIFMMGAGPGGASRQCITMSQHTTTGRGRVRITDGAGDFDLDITANEVQSETATALLATTPGATRTAMCGYIDMLNATVGISVNGAAFTTNSSVVGTGLADNTWDDAEMNAYGFTVFARNSPVSPADTPIVRMGGTATTLGTKISGLFITRFDTHPGLDYIDQLATEFYDTIGAFPEILKTGKY